VKLSDALDNYYVHSEKSSNIARNLGFAGIALIWVFKVEVDGEPSVPSGLLLPAFLLVLGLTLDFLQYVSASLLWGFFHRKKEKAGMAQDADVEASRYINWPALSFFWTKLVVIFTAYILILLFLREDIAGAATPT